MSEGHSIFGKSQPKLFPWTTEGASTGRKIDLGLLGRAVEMVP